MTVYTFIRVERTAFFSYRQSSRRRGGPTQRESAAAPLLKLNRDLSRGYVTPLHYIHLWAPVKNIDEIFFQKRSTVSIKDSLDSWLNKQRRYTKRFIILLSVFLCDILKSPCHFLSNILEKAIGRKLMSQFRASEGRTDELVALNSCFRSSSLLLPSHTHFFCSTVFTIFSSEKQF